MTTENLLSLEPSKKSLIYFNNASTSWPKAPGVEAQLKKVLDHPLSDIYRSTSGENLIELGRKSVADYFHLPKAEHVIFTANATQALNIILWGISIPAGSKVVTSVTEHNSVLRPLVHRAQQESFEIEYIQTDEDGNFDLSQYEKILNAAKVSLVVLNHVSNVTGKINPIAECFSRAHQMGAQTVLDASQSAGHMDLDLNLLAADYVAVTGHKALLGPQGIGLLLLNSERPLKQIFVGGTGVRSDLVMHPEEVPLRYEAGTYNYLGICGLQESLKWLTANQLMIKQKKISLTSHLCQILSEIKNLRVLAGSQEIPLVSFTVKDRSPEEIGYILSEVYGIICRTGLHCAPMIHQNLKTAPQGTVRLSLSAFNTLEEVELLAVALHKIVQ